MTRRLRVGLVSCATALTFAATQGCKEDAGNNTGGGKHGIPQQPMDNSGDSSGGKSANPPKGQSGPHVNTKRQLPNDFKALLDDAPANGPGVFTPTFRSSTDFFTNMDSIVQGHSPHGMVRIWYSSNVKNVINRPTFTVPQGTVAIKKYQNAAGAGYAVMIKMAPGFDAANNDWSFEMHDDTGALLQAPPPGKNPECSSCHAAAQAKDFLAGTELGNPQTGANGNDSMTTDTSSGTGTDSSVWVDTGSVDAGTTGMGSTNATNTGGTGSVSGPTSPGPMSPGPMSPGPMSPGPMSPGPVSPGPPPAWAQGPGLFEPNFMASQDFITNMGGPIQGHGAHGKVQIWYSSNIKDMLSNDTLVAPTGSVAIAEFSTDGKPDGAAVMIKKQPGYDPAHNDWYFEVRDAWGTVMQNPAPGMNTTCSGCHSAALATDFLAGTKLGHEVPSGSNGPGLFLADYSTSTQFFTQMSAMTDANTPHGSVGIWYSANLRGIVNQATFTAPPGSVAVERYVSGNIMGLAVMIKVPGSDPGNNDWRYEVRDRYGNLMLDPRPGHVDGCVACHANAKATDYLQGGLITN